MKQQKEKPPEQLQLTGGMVRGSPTLRSFCHTVTSAGGEAITSRELRTEEAAFATTSVAAEIGSISSLSSGTSVTMEPIFFKTSLQAVTFRMTDDAVISAALSRSPVSSDCAFTRKTGAPCPVVTPSHTGLARRFLTGRIIPQNAGRVKETT